MQAEVPECSEGLNEGHDIVQAFPKLYLQSVTCMVGVFGVLHESPVNRELYFVWAPANCWRWLCGLQDNLLFIYGPHGLEEIAQRRA